MSSQEIIIETLDVPEEKTVSENIDFSNLEMDEKASKNLKENKLENTKTIETGTYNLIKFEKRFIKL